MSPVRADIRPLIEELARKDGLPPSAVADLEATINSSPYLANVMSSAIESGAVKHLAIAHNPHEAGRFDSTSGTINLDPSNFDKTQWRDASARRDNLAVVLGHETGHALLADAQLREAYMLEYAATEEIRKASREETAADLTEPAGRYVNFMRRNEAMAELVGMNALASRTTNGGTEEFNRREFLQRVDRSTSCVEKGVLAEGIHLSPDGIQLTENKLNSPAVEAVAQCFTDKVTRLGLHGDSGYRAYYGSSVMATISDVHSEYAKGTTMHVPEIELDMEKLKLDPRKIERAGLDLGGRGNSFDYVDISGGRREREAVTHTSPDTNSPARQAEPIAPHAPTKQPIARADQPQHPDHPAFDAIRSTVRSDGRWNEDQATNIAADLLRAHKADPLSHRLDRVVIGNTTNGGEVNVFAVYAPHGNKSPVFMTHVEANAASQVPAQRSLDQVEQINQQQTQERSQAQQQPDAQTQAGPRMSMQH